MARAVYHTRVQYNVSRLKHEVSEYDVDAGGGIGDEDACFDGAVEEGSYGGAGSVEVLGILVKDEVVGAGFGCVLEFAHFSADGGGVGAKGAFRRRM